MHHQLTVPVAAPAEALWDCLVDVERWPEWTRSMRRVTTLDDGPLALGARVRIKQPLLAPVTWAVTDLQPGRSFTWEAHLPGALTVATHTVDPAPAGTSQLTLTIDQRGPVGRAISTAYGRLTRRYVQMEADGLAVAAARRLTD